MNDDPNTDPHDLALWGAFIGGFCGSMVGGFIVAMVLMVMK